MSHHRAEPRFPVGTIFRHRKSRDSDWLIYVVEDYWVTRNLAGEIVKAGYLVSHSFLGCRVTDSDFLEVTIARALENGGRK